MSLAVKKHVLAHAQPIPELSDRARWQRVMLIAWSRWCIGVACCSGNPDGHVSGSPHVADQNVADQNVPFRFSVGGHCRLINGDADGCQCAVPLGIRFRAQPTDASRFHASFLIAFGRQWAMPLKGLFAKMHGMIDLRNAEKPLHLHLITGKLARHALEENVSALASQYGFSYSIEVMPITVAALMTAKWLAGKIRPPEQTTHIVLPGFCPDLNGVLADALQLPIVVGPRDCRDLVQLFGAVTEPAALDQHSVKIIAEINHVPRHPLAEIVQIAKRLVADGADMIDLGCQPGERFEQIGDFVSELTHLGIAVSVDSFDPWEVEQACQRGAQLVLSVNSSNWQHAADWGQEVVVIPDSPEDLESLDRTIESLAAKNVPMRLDPILEPIGFGFSRSLVRYADVRARYPELPMMMGIGNVTELSDVDSAGVNLLLMGICQELKIDSVLTTQVINWARSSVRECDIARRLVHHAVRRGVPPKNLSDQLVMLRDRRVRSFSNEALGALAAEIKDNNYRLFAHDETLHVVSRELHLSDKDPFRLFDDLMQREIADNVDPGHAFYLGYELAKAKIALVLGKQYNQDRELDWGLLTQTEDMYRIKRSNRHRSK